MPPSSVEKKEGKKEKLHVFAHGRGLGEQQ